MLSVATAGDRAGGGRQPVEVLREFLDSHGIKHVLLDHSPAYSQREIAASARVPGRVPARTLMVKIDGDMAMAVIPASYEVDVEALRRAAGAEEAELAHECEFGPLFPDCDLGAMPPFGNLCDIPVYVAESVSEDSEIVFKACSHTQLIRMACADFARLVSPIVIRFTTKF